VFTGNLSQFQLVRVLVPKNSQYAESRGKEGFNNFNILNHNAYFLGKPIVALGLLNEDENEPRFPTNLSTGLVEMSPRLGERHK